MAKKEKRFLVTDKQELGAVKILVDQKTGVNYLYYSSGYGGGLTPLLNRDGTPVVTPTLREDL